MLHGKSNKLLPTFRTFLQYFNNCNQVFPKARNKNVVLGNFQQRKEISTSRKVYNNETVNFTIVDRSGTRHKTKGCVGDSILEVVIDQDLQFENYGVCGGTIACSTCHVVFEREVFEKMEEPLMDETDMLDLACGLTDTSRLGCQTLLDETMEGMVVTLPREITDARDL